jgi:hypothetical protein
MSRQNGMKPRSACATASITMARGCSPCQYFKIQTFSAGRVLAEILDIGEKALGAPVEIEFAVNLQKRLDKRFCHLLYSAIRPLYIHSEELLLMKANLPQNIYCSIPRKAWVTLLFRIFAI